jgi:hypothetical protein
VVKVEEGVVVGGGGRSTGSMRRSKVLRMATGQRIHEEHVPMWGGGQRVSEVGQPVLRETQWTVGRSRVRRVRRDAMSGVLCRYDGAAQSGSGSIFSALVWLGYFEGLDSKRGIAWRMADLFRSARVSRAGPYPGGAGSFDDIADATIDLDTHRAVFTWGLRCRVSPVWSMENRSR